MLPKALVILLVAAAVLDLTLAQRPITRNRVASSLNRGRSRTLTTTTTTTTTTPPPSTFAEDEESIEIIEEEIIVEEEPIPVTVPPTTVRRLTVPRVTVPATPAPTTAARRPTTNSLRTTASQATPSPSTTRARPVVTQDLEEDIKTTNVVGTVRRYSTLNADGSFTFGYENEDGSFKEETRGSDCVVRGMYGYVDPDGVRREFTYVSGNPCDPNAQEEEEESNEATRIVNLPARRPAIQVQQSSEEEDEATLLQQFNVNPQPARTQTKAPTRKVVVSKARVPATNAAPRAQPQRQQIQEETFFGTATPAPTRQTTVPRSVSPSNTGSNQFNFEAEIARFNPQTQPAAPRPVPVARPVFSDEEDREEEERPSRPRTGTRTFTSELIFDRNTNQFQSNLVQRIPDQADISIREKLIGFVPSTSTTTIPTPIRVAATTPEPASTVARTQRPATTTARPRVAEPEINFNSFGPSADQLQRQRQQQQQQQQQNLLRQQAQPQPQTFFANQAQQPQNAFPSQQFAPNNAFPVQDHRFTQPQFNNFGNNQFASQQTPSAGGFPGAFGASPSQPPASFLPNQQFSQQPQQQPQPQRFAPSAFSAPAPAVRTQSAPVRPAQSRPAVDPNTFASGQIDAFLSG